MSDERKTADDLFRVVWDAIDNATGIHLMLSTKEQEQIIEHVTRFASSLTQETKTELDNKLKGTGLFYDFPESLPLYKDSGLWQLRTDNMEDVIVQQAVNESFEHFIERCKTSNLVSSSPDKKPLDELDKNELLEIAEILGYTESITRPKSVCMAKARTFIEIQPTDEGFSYPPFTALKVYQYLQHRGYDVPIFYPLPSAPKTEGGKS